MSRPVVFLLVGLGFLGYWLGVDQPGERAAAQTGWFHVVLLSGLLLLLGAGIVLFGTLLGSPLARRAAYVAGAGAALCGAVNVIEHGLGLDWASAVFVLCLLVTDLALLVVMATLLLTEAGHRRMLALVPIGTVIGIAVFDEAGGAVLALTWVGAGVVAYLGERRSAGLTGGRMHA